MKTDNKTSSEDKAPTRRPYVKPAIVASEIFETMALSCANAGECTFLGPDDKS